MYDQPQFHCWSWGTSSDRAYGFPVSGFPSFHSRCPIAVSKYHYAHQPSLKALQRSLVPIFTAIPVASLGFLATAPAGPSLLRLRYLLRRHTVKAPPQKIQVGVRLGMNCCYCTENNISASDKHLRDYNAGRISTHHTNSYVCEVGMEDISAMASAIH